MICWAGQSPPPVTFITATWLPPPVAASLITALVNVKYHGGDNGYYPLTPTIILNGGYTAINTHDMISSYNEIVLVHESVMVITNYWPLHHWSPDKAHSQEGSWIAPSSHVP